MTRQRNLGCYHRISPQRRFIGDLLHFAAKIPTIPVCRRMDLSPLMEPRREHPDRPSWALIFLKAYAQLAVKNPMLRLAWVGFPYPRLYEHPESIAALAVERQFPTGRGTLIGLIRAPECQSFQELAKALHWYKSEPIESIGFYRRALRIGRLPTPIRRLLWWSSLEVDGDTRARRLGTFGISSYGSLGAESLHPISPLTVTLTYGPIDDQGQVNVKMIYDHRVLDGTDVARRLADLETELHGPIRQELIEDRDGGTQAHEPAKVA